MSKIVARVTPANLNNLRELLLLALKQVQELQITLNQISNFRVQASVSTDKKQTDEIVRKIGRYLNKRVDKSLKGSDKDASH